MKRQVLFAYLFYATIVSAETLVPMKDQINLSVSIYNDNRAFVKDERRVPLTQGLNELAFAGVSANMMPQTALLFGKGITTQEQNFNFDLLNRESLLEKSVGQTVLTEYIDPATGKITNGTATLLAYNNGRPVLKIGNKIETNYPGRIIFDKVPPSLRPEPTLVISAMSQQTITEPIQLDYLTTGMSWNADYVARLDANEKQMDLNGFVTLTNHSGTDYNNATLQLIAGKVNTVTEDRLYTNRRTGKTVQAMLDVAGNMSSESLSDFYIYTVPHQTTLLSNQTKQVALLSGKGIQVNKTYELDNAFPVYSDEITKAKPLIFVTFKNTSENQLGMPLPKGIIRLYKQDAKGKTQFVGEDRIDHTADQENVRLKMGEAFNLTASMKRTNYRSLSDKIKTASFEISVKNGGENSAFITIKQVFPNGFQLMEQSIEGQKLTSNQVQWVVQVPAKGETKLTYKVKWGE